jgi:anti-anti-sigma factor
MGVGLNINLEKINQKMIVRIDGRIDASSSSILERKLHALIEEDHNYLLLDFSKVNYLSSAGLRVLLSTAKQLKAKKGFLVIFSVLDEVEEIIKMAGFDRILTILPAEKEALQFHQ